MIDDIFLTLALSPVLIPQAIYTKKVTPKLPEPLGPRKGSIGEVNSGRPLRVLVLGDSAAAGVGVESQEEALSGQLLKRLSIKSGVEWWLHAETGLKTADILSQLTALPAFEIDLVVTSLGVNDVTAGTRCKRWSELQQELIALLVSKFKAKQIYLTNVPPMHLFPSLPQPLRWYLGRRSSMLNKALEALALSADHLKYVTIEFPMNADFFAADGFHPSAKAYALWSEQLCEHIYEWDAISD